MAHHGQLWGSDLTDLTNPALNQAPPGGVVYSWLGGSGESGNGDWNTAADWQGGVVPPASATATFATGDSGYTVTGDATIGAIKVIGDAVTFDGAVTQNTGGPANFLIGAMDATVTLDSNSVFNGENGDIAFGNGSLLDVQGTLLTGGGSADVVIAEGLSGTLVAAGPIDLNQLYVQTGGSFTGGVTLNDGGSITLDTASTFGGGTIIMLGSGTVYEALAPGQTSGSAGIGEAIEMAGGGTLTLASDAGAAFAVAGPISGSGALLVNNGSVELTGVNTYTGNTIVENATLTADGQGAVPGGLILLSDAGFMAQPDSTGAVNFTDTVAGFGATDTVDAAAGNLLVYASQTGLFTFVGGLGADTLVGGAGALNVTGGAAGDVIFGSSGVLTYTGGAGASTVVGGSGAVSATGGSGGDVIFGGTSGQDVLNTGAGPTTLVGGAGAQLFATGTANSVLVDGGGNSTLNAMASTGNDTLFGGNTGSDTIFSGAGTNTVVLNGGATTLYTGGTADVFAGAGALDLVYVAGIAGGVTNVAGFNLNTDQISLEGYAQGTAAQVLDNETVAGGNTILQIPQGDQIVLFGVTGLTMGNFT